MRASSPRTPLTLAVALALPLVAACGGDTGGEMEGEAGAGEEAAAESGSQPSMRSAATPESASLNPLGDSNVRGQVRFTVEGDSMEVHVAADNLPGPGEYASHVHNGACGEPGGVLTALTSVTAPEAGAGEATTVVDATQLEAGSPYLVMVHGLEGAPVACADVPAAVVQGGGM